MLLVLAWLPLGGYVQRSIGLEAHEPGPFTPNLHDSTPKINPTGITQTLRFVDTEGEPLGQRDLRILCYRSALDGTPFADLRRRTDATGSLIRPVPSECTRVAALEVLHIEPGFDTRDGNRYVVYRTSWPRGSRHLWPADAAVGISGTNLLLFDVAASLEWTPQPGSSIRQEIVDGLRQASDYLYDLSDGQVGFGAVDLRVGGDGWNRADIRLLAANDYRPSARVGGIVSETVRYTTHTGIETLFQPGEIYTGRSWDGRSALDREAGRWDRPAAYRSLAHEWLHYALFLYDEYQDERAEGRSPTFCTCPDLPAVGEEPNACFGLGPDLAASAMSYHYTASELWERGVPDSCRGTDQMRVHGRSDRETLARWSEIQGRVTEWLVWEPETVAGPAPGLVADLFGRPLPATDSSLYLPSVINRTVPAGSPPGVDQPGKEVPLALRLGDVPPSQNLATLQPQLYTGHARGDSLPDRLIYQGGVARTTTGTIGLATLLDVGPQDDLIIHLDRYGGLADPRDRLVGVARGADLMAQAGEVTLEPDPFVAGLNLEPEIRDGVLSGLKVELVVTRALSETPRVRLCLGDREVGCAAPVSMETSGGVTWTTRFSASPGMGFPHRVVLDVEAPGSGRLVRWVEAAGGVGPAYVFGEAPLRDGGVMVDLTRPLSESVGSVLVMAAAEPGAMEAPLPPGIDGLIAPPLDIDIDLAGPTIPLTRAPGLIGEPAVVTLFYAEPNLARLGIPESHIYLLHYSRLNHVWRLVPTSGRSPELDWLASIPVNEDGIFAIGWSQHSDLELTPGKFVDPPVVVPGDRVRYQILYPGLPQNIPPSNIWIQDPLDPVLHFSGELWCSSGWCGYDPAQHTIFWQGNLAPNELLLIEFEALLNVTQQNCTGQLRNQALIFEGEGVRSVQANAEVLCPPALAGSEVRGIPGKSRTAWIVGSGLISTFPE